MRRGGFTLIELVLVAAILAVISGIAIPRYSSSMSSFRARTAARRLAADISMTQAQARATSAPKLIEFSASRYVVKGIAGIDGKATYEVNLAEDPYHAALKLSLTDDATVLTFDGYGWPDRGGQIQIQSGSHARVLSIEPTTGAVSVQ